MYPVIPFFFSDVGGVSCDPIPKIYTLLKIESNLERCLGVLVAPPSQRAGGPISAGEPPDNFTSCVNLDRLLKHVLLENSMNRIGVA